MAKTATSPFLSDALVAQGVLCWLDAASLARCACTQRRWQRLVTAEEEGSMPRHWRRLLVAKHVSWLACPAPAARMTFADVAWAERLSRAKPLGDLMFVLGCRASWYNLDLVVSVVPTATAATMAVVNSLRPYRRTRCSARLYGLVVQEAVLALPARASGLAPEQIAGQHRTPITLAGLVRRTLVAPFEADCARTAKRCPCALRTGRATTASCVCYPARSLANLRENLAVAASFQTRWHQRHISWWFDDIRNLVYSELERCTALDADLAPRLATPLFEFRSADHWAACGLLRCGQLLILSVPCRLVFI